jgi:hypothetical protein
MVRLSSALHAITLSCAVSAGALLFAAGAGAQSVQKQCGDEWKAAKAAGTVPAGQKWTEFLKECRARTAQSGAATTTAAPPAAAPATTAAPANPLKPATTAPAGSAAKTPAVPTAAPAATTSAPMAPAAPAAATAAAPAGTAAKKPMSPGRTAEIARQRQCGAEWRANKAQLQAATPGLKWPKYWSECNTRLKAAGQ